MTPPAPITGSAMTAATVSGPSARIAFSTASAAPMPGLLVAFPAIGVGRRDLDEARHQRPEHLVIGGHAGRAHRRHRDAVIGVDARDDLGLFGLSLIFQ